MPSLSLIKKICYQNEFRSCATTWGQDHEATARRKYGDAMSSFHNSFTMKESGLLLHTSYPFLAASPDGTVTCSCCGNGCIEIKCPYKFQDNSIEEMINLGSYLKKDEQGNIFLLPTHQYMYQIQTQLLVTEYNYCDLFVWTKIDSVQIRIKPSNAMFEEIKEKAFNFFV